MRTPARRWKLLLAATLVGAALFLAARRLLGATPSAPLLPTPEPEPAVRPAPEPPVVEVTRTVPDFVLPVDGTCPSLHPVKAKDSSKIFHVEGGLSYGRTNPDRCYLSPAAAEADGYRAAKR